MSTIASGLGPRVLVRGSTHRGGGILDLVMPDVPDVCKVRVGCLIGRSNHFHVGIVLNLSPGAPRIEFSQEVELYAPPPVYHTLVCDVN